MANIYSISLSATLINNVKAQTIECAAEIILIPILVAVNCVK